MAVAPGRIVVRACRAGGCDTLRQTRDIVTTAVVAADTGPVTPPSA